MRVDMVESGDPKLFRLCLLYAVESLQVHHLHEKRVFVPLRKLEPEEESLFSTELQGEKFAQQKGHLLAVPVEREEV
jgi:hypothetical protein